MSINRGQHDKFERLRQRAQELILKNPEAANGQESEVTDLIHELQIHQTELELQNEELKRSQEEISSLQKEYFDLYEFAPCGYITLDSKEFIQQINLTGTTILGMARGDIIAKTIFSNYIEYSWRGYFREVLNKSAREHEKKSLELKLHPKNTAAKWVKMLVQPAGNENGSIVQWQVILMDISEQKEAETSLHNKEKYLRSILESQNELVATLDLEYRIHYVNETYCRIFGKTRDELRDQPFLSLVQAEDIDNTLKVMQSLYTPPHRIHLEQRARTVNGWRWIAWEDTGILDDNGEVVEILAVGRDITERKLAGEAMRRSENYLRTIFETSGTALCIIEEDTTISLANTYFEELSGYSRQELGTKKSWTEFIHPDDVELLKEKHYLHHRDPDNPLRNYEFRMITRNGEERNILASLDKIPGTNRMIASGIDITER